MRSRGFTIIEVMLAAVLGTAVVVVSMTLFSAMARTEQRTAVRDFGMKELTRFNAAVRKAISQIVVLGYVPKAKPKSPTLAKSVVGFSETPASEPEEERKEPEEHPRVLLEPDPLIGLQRLELVVAEPPVLGGVDGVQLEPDAGKRFSVSRGAFVLRPSVGTMPIEVQRAIPEGTPVYDVWWVPVDRGEPGLAPVGRAEGVLVARGLIRCVWKFYRSDENRRLQALMSAEATARSELPAYFEMEVVTAQGQSARWMFEVGWTVQSRPTGATSEAGGDVPDRSGASGPTGDRVLQGTPIGRPVRGAGGEKGDPEAPR